MRLYTSKAETELKQLGQALSILRVMNNEVIGLQMDNTNSIYYLHRLKPHVGTMTPMRTFEIRSQKIKANDNSIGSRDASGTARVGGAIHSVLRSITGKLGDILDEDRLPIDIQGHINQFNTLIDLYRSRIRKSIYWDDESNVYRDDSGNSKFLFSDFLNELEHKQLGASLKALEHQLQTLTEVPVIINGEKRLIQSSSEGALASKLFFMRLAANGINDRTKLPQIVGASVVNSLRQGDNLVNTVDDLCDTFPEIANYCQQLVDDSKPQIAKAVQERLYDLQVIYTHCQITQSEDSRILPLEYLIDIANASYYPDRLQSLSDMQLLLGEVVTLNLEEAGALQQLYAAFKTAQSWTDANQIYNQNPIYAEALTAITDQMLQRYPQRASAFIPLAATLNMLPELAAKEQIQGRINRETRPAIHIR